MQLDVFDKPFFDERRPTAAPDAARRPGHLVDSHGRTIHDLRLSITDRCNFRCTYCMEPDDRFLPKLQLLQFDEYLRVVDACMKLGIRKIRLTGGEPTLWPDLDRFIAALGGLGLDDLAMTSNGSLFDPARVQGWKNAGLRRITFSLDSLQPERVAAITRSTTPLATVIEAIDLAQRVGFDPIKVNAVVMRGVNDDELPAFATFARETGVDMRLIEFMPLDSGHAWDKSVVVTADEMIERLMAGHGLERDDDANPHSTSINFRFTDGAPGRVGIIAPVSRPFCGACNRLRITAEGKVRPCLFSLDEWDLRPVLRGDADDEQLQSFIVDAVWGKQAGHGIGSKTFVQPERTMSAIGG